MTDTALTNRLRQQSRRAGLMVGVTMALTIGICIAGFAGIFSVLAPFTRDFIDERATAQPTATTAATAAPNATQPPAPAAAQVELTAPPEPEPTPPPQPTAAIVPRETVTSSSTTSTFQATHTSNARFSINLRSEPNTTSPAVTVLEPGTPVQFLGERTGTEATDWMQFRTEQGQEGWMRQIDVDAVTPGA